MTEREKTIERIKLLNQQALEALTNDIAEAERRANEARSLAEQIGDEENVGASLLRIAEAEIIQAKFQSALAKAETARKIAQRLNHREKEADALNVIARIHYVSSNYEQSLSSLEQAIARYRDVGNEKKRLILVGNVGKVMIALGRYDEALSHLNVAASGFKLAKGSASPYHDIGDAHYYLGDYAASLHAYQTAIEHYKSVEDKSREASVQASICKLFTAMGALDKSLEAARRGLALLSEIGADAMAWQFHREIGKVYYEIGNDEAALEAFEKSLTALDAYQTAIVQHHIAKIYARRNQIELALNLLLKCYETYQQVKNENALIAGSAEIATLYLDIDDFEQARAFATKSLQHSQSTKNRSGECVARLTLGKIQLKKGNPESALTQLEDALKIAEEIKAKSLLPELYKTLAEASKHIGELEQSLKFFEHYINSERDIFNEKSDERLKNLQVVYQVEQTKRDAEREKQKLREIDAIKSRFFANISHEFRTPLTLILGHLTDLEELERNANKKNKLSVIRRSSTRLLSLINELLDLSKLEAGELRLSISQNDLVGFVKGLTFAFESIAYPKGIEIEFESSEPTLMAYFDTDKVEKILSNLLSNAFKFTTQGKVSCQLSLLPKSRVRIAISDTGIGIPKEHLKHIFDRFYQAENAYARRYQGTGIGLALVKELVELHKGKIRVESEIEKGSTFIVELPISKEAFAGEKFDEQTDIKTKSLRSVKSESQKQTTQPVSSRHQKNDIILVVEDNEDMRAFIVEKLSGYAVHEAINGKEGFEKAKAILPDLIISDVMMPEMDGYALCEKVKSDEATNHIPIILLTAKGSTESKIQGLETGADDYLLKPFNSREVQARVKNIIAQRKKLRESFLKSLRLDANVASEQRYPFLEKAEGLVKSRLDDEAYGASELAYDLCLSLSQVQRKFKQLAGQNPTEFIRAIRLKKAAEMLRAKAGNVSEVAHLCGFGSVAYFSTAFKKQFGKSPTAFH